ncbi:MAG: sigma-54-dependent Fis family transcriptional regulator [Deltaproteobacteria bacterium]|nr:sigma-54-dependent Fis family transcriptional regulator [Deltaproteobacteria bacterium]
MENELIGVSENIRRIRELIDRVASTGLNTVVYGETGVGKELAVQSLYQKSDRAGKPFVKVNCAALPDTLLESEMFGYEQGAFTGAERRRRGKFEQAHGGVLFLDEIGDMSLPLQSKLLHVLQGGDFTPLGSEKAVKTSAWVIAATNHDLEKDLVAGKFREDLYYRLSAIKIYIEPLRNRPDDIPHLIHYYIEQYKAQFAGKALRIPLANVIQRLCAYRWPGNVRELQNVLKRIMILGDGEEGLNGLLAPAPPPAAAPNPVGREQTLVSGDALDPHEFNDLSALSLKKVRKRAMDKVEKEVIGYVLGKTGWNRSKATKILKISYKTLLYKIKDLGIEPPPDVM